MHRINRVEIELEAEGEPLAREVSGLTAGMLEGRLAPVIDRVCGELSGAEALDRLDRLEVDLGGVPAERFEEELPARLEQALRAALAEALRRQGPRADAPGRASLELLETFALTGSVPWWADAREEGVVARHFARAAAEAPEALVALVRRVSADTGAVERLARACDAEALLALAGAPEEEEEGAIPLERRRALLIELAGSEPASAGRGARRPRAAETTGTSGRGGRKGAEAEKRAGVAERREGPGVGSEERADVIGREARAEPVAAERVADAGAEAEERAGVVGSGPSEASEREADTAAEVVEPGGVAGREVQAPERGAIAEPEVARRALTPGPAVVAAPPAPPPALAAAIRAARRAVLSRLDEVYVDTSGLVLLWPFLERFFERLGLIGEDRQFTTEASALQGVALLEALATGDPDPLELRLALPKVLCGRDLESDFQLEHPLSPEQLAEAEALLTAAIDRAGVLGDLSISGFHATFLQRRGALTTRDGAWLLQVERQAHDLLLDRFPWSWGWVKLPWMPHPMQVEW